ncbi:class I SAM-dependent methyltransferase [Chloroflexota bacterium]
MKCYDIFASIYDQAISKTYLPYRQVAIEALLLQPSLTVLDIGCGTGLNFGLIMSVIGDQGTLIGIDSSARMLAKAQRRINSQRWENVHLLQLDVRKLTYKDLEILTTCNIMIDRVICTLGLTVFPSWQDVFTRTYNLLIKDGRYSIMDIFNDKRTIRTKIIRILAKANNSRRFWEPLEKECKDYWEERYSLAHGDTVIVASGTKS